MSESPVAGLEQRFGSLEDPRVDRTKLHELPDIIVIAICATICGADGWTWLVSQWSRRNDFSVMRPPERPATTYPACLARLWPLLKRIIEGLGHAASYPGAFTRGLVSVFP